MKFSTLAVLGGFAAYVSAVPAPPTHVVHEKREHQLNKWSRRSVKLNRDAIIPMSVGLTQRNLNQGYDFLMDVSHPESKNYGKHWSMQKIKETFAPSDATIEAVKSWLIESGIENERLKMSNSLSWIRFNVTVDEAESLLKTEYGIYTNNKNGNEHLACEDYSVPAHIQEHIDFITPTVHFDATVKKERKRRDLQSRSLNIRPLPQVVPSPDTAVQPQVVFNLTNCNTYITPDCLRALYNFTNGTLSGSSYGIVEYTPQAYLQPDLDLFYSNLQRQINAGTAPTVDLIDGATVQTSSQSFNDNGESDLDLQYAISLVYPQKVTLYQTGDAIEGASFNNLLDALDASFCTTGSGDNPTFDAIYPDTNPGGYNGAENCGTIKPASVISTSYGYNEADLPADYETRQCNEYMKLGLAGVSVLYSSGDYGVAGNGGECCSSAQCAGGVLNDGDSGAFNPSFPGTCPYVTSVGATQVKANGAVTATNPEEACETVIYSGGGFSNVFAIPSYQSSAVATYFKSHKPSYSASRYNNSQAVRGFPDVAANGANYVVAVDGSLSLVYGTSASSPVFGSIVTLINNERIAAGKGAVGFLNPTLYANPSAFTDITSGGNQGCGTNGFTAVAGWDPVTGLGTPNYPKLLSVFQALP
ncbi:hypothetical protein EG329_005103 [Mollisiaceae sp. DMI_Dod_QoI]|nr:hypothetical protein EG329_005103 [Helotiales sp. DMI_Dod_QoI]